MGLFGSYFRRRRNLRAFPINARFAPPAFDRPSIGRQIGGGGPVLPDAARILIRRNRLQTGSPAGSRSKREAFDMDLFSLSLRHRVFQRVVAVIAGTGSCGRDRKVYECSLAPRLLKALRRCQYAGRSGPVPLDRKFGGISRTTRLSYVEEASNPSLRDAWKPSWSGLALIVIGEFIVQQSLDRQPGRNRLPNNFIGSAHGN